MLPFLRSIFVPAAVFQSVIVGGAYGTGREVVEYISRFGPTGGIYAIAIIAVAFSVILAVSFEFGRKFAAWNYRTYLRNLLGNAWVLYELLFLALLVLILAITGSAAGTVLSDRFGIPSNIGIGLMFLAVVILNYFGRALVNRTLTLGAILLVSVLALFFAYTLFYHNQNIVTEFSTNVAEPGWLQSGLTFATYNSALIPAIIYCASGLKTSAQTISAGILAGALGVLPAAIFHVCFMAGYPEVLAQQIPTYWMIEYLGLDALLTLYVVILFATIVQTGVGVLQGFNERLDGWRQEVKGQPFSQLQHALMAGALLLLSLLMAKFGIVDLVAKGYSTIAWGFVIVFTIPTLTIGLYKITRV